jgi:hypothetical protein
MQWLAGTTGANKSLKEKARLPELASHTLPNSVFWEAGPNRTGS